VIFTASSPHPTVRCGGTVRLIGDAATEPDHPEILEGEVMVVDPFGEIHVGFPTGNEREYSGIYKPEDLEIIDS
jgi:hypothetical protein